jgi:hypothetical protein
MQILSGTSLVGLYLLRCPILWTIAEKGCTVRFKGLTIIFGKTSLFSWPPYGHERAGEGAFGVHGVVSADTDS